MGLSVAIVLAMAGACSDAVMRLGRLPESQAATEATAQDRAWVARSGSGSGDGDGSGYGSGYGYGYGDGDGDGDGSGYGSGYGYGIIWLEHDGRRIVGRDGAMAVIRAALGVP